MYFNVVCIPSPPETFKQFLRQSRRTASAARRGTSHRCRQRGPQKQRCGEETPRLPQCQCGRIDVWRRYCRLKVFCTCMYVQWKCFVQGRFRGFFTLIKMLFKIGTYTIFWSAILNFGNLMINLRSATTGTLISSFWPKSRSTFFLGSAIFDPPSWIFWNFTSESCSADPKAYNHQHSPCKMNTWESYPQSNFSKTLNAFISKRHFSNWWDISRLQFLTDFDETLHNLSRIKFCIEILEGIFDILKFGFLRHDFVANFTGKKLTIFLEMVTIFVKINFSQNGSSISVRNYMENNVPIPFLFQIHLPRGQMSHRWGKPGWRRAARPGAACTESSPSKRQNSHLLSKRCQIKTYKTFDHGELF